MNAIVSTAADGHVFASRGTAKVDKVETDQLPADLVHAVIAVEDRRFYSHHGIGSYPRQLLGYRAGAFETAITVSLAMLNDFAEFASVVELIDVAGDIETLLAELTEIFARAYLANAYDILTTIVFIHGVTSPTALGGITPYLSKTTARSALHYAWQSGCALYACFGTRAMAEDVEPCAQNAQTLIDRALANGDEHMIKFTEACLRRNALVPSPAYRAAVDHALGTMPRR